MGQALLPIPGLLPQRGGGTRHHLLLYQYLLGNILKTLDTEYFTTAMKNSVEEKSMKGVVSLCGIRRTQGEVNLLVNMDKIARIYMVTAGCRLSHTYLILNIHNQIFASCPTKIYIFNRLG